MSRNKFSMLYGITKFLSNQTVQIFMIAERSINKNVLGLGTFAEWYDHVIAYQIRVIHIVPAGEAGMVL